MLFGIPLHPVIVHTPIAMIVIALLFELIGRLTDLDWWRKAAFAMLIIGVIGAGAAVLSGNAVEEAAEHQGVPERALEAHQEAGLMTLWLGLAAVLARALAARKGPARGAMSALALLLLALTVGAVSVAGYRGGSLVYDHGAGVHVTQQQGATHDEGGGGGRGGRDHDADGD